MALHRWLADNNNAQSVATGLRRKRFQLFVRLLSLIDKPARILDVGGTQRFWEMMDFPATSDIQITLLNTRQEKVSLPYFESVPGDGRAMSMFRDGEFDIVFSNSVIEHVGRLADQRRLADEIGRVGRYYYVQTPNRHFPLEPHFVFPFFQYLPLSIRIWLVQNFRLGWHQQMPDYAKARSEVMGIRLLTRTEVAALFPRASVYEEKFLGMTKSFVAYTPIESR